MWEWVWKMMPQSSLGVRLLGVLLMERYNAGRKELVSRKKKIMRSVLNILSSLCPWGLWVEYFMCWKCITSPLAFYQLWMCLVLSNWPCRLPVYVLPDRLWKLTVPHWFHDLFYFGLQLAIKITASGGDSKIPSQYFASVRYTHPC